MIVDDESFVRQRVRPRRVRRKSLAVEQERIAGKDCGVLHRVCFFLLVLCREVIDVRDREYGQFLVPTSEDVAVSDGRLLPFVVRDSPAIDGVTPELYNKIYYFYDFKAHFGGIKYIHIVV